ncbi:MAG: YesL family protein [Solobacterium sp.]|jgi:uncharacterized membrane protein YesL|nr:YesL family protein [Solobacterium sp.]
MKNLFGYDNPLIVTLERLGNDIILSVLWIAFCIPVVTIIPSCTAAYHTMVKVIRNNENGVVKDFVSTFVANAKQGILLSLVMIGFVFLIYTGINLGWQMMSQNVLWSIYFILGIVIAVIVIGWFIFLPAVLSRFQMKWTEVMRASLFIVIHKPLKALLLSLSFCLTCFAGWYFPTFIIIIPGLFCDLTSGFIERELQKMIEQYHLERTDTDVDKTSDDNNDQERTPFELNELMEKKRRMEKRNHG